MRYQDRRQAGRVLAAAIDDAGIIDGDLPVLVLGVARGGMPVAAEVARHLGAQLDVVIGRKLGAPGNPEFAVGAIGMGGAPVIHRDVVRRLRIDQSYLDHEVERQRAEVKRRLDVYRGNRPPLQPAGKAVIVIDDGVATGATLSAVLSWVREAGASTIVCAVPVGPPESLAMLESVADEVVCPLTPRRFRAVGEWYDDFAQTSDTEVRELLAT